VVETYAKVSLHANMSEWENTKFILLTGKGLDHKESSINVYFKNGIKFKISISPIGDFPDKFEYINLAPIDTSKYLEGYDAVFYDAIEGNKLIFTSTDEILTAWKIFMPILDDWKNNDKNLKLYEKGSAFSD
jgi:glucose-6-phosphate 1-dehydrogenase